ncbi:hypothetical protein C2S52_016452 [Perilla frutescens var. hirtella]|nr:hypothetical protein C2S52_016452 [Perilla frutescens var. hirtella]
MECFSGCFGRYEITKKAGQIAYKLDLHESSIVHPIFYVSVLKKKMGGNIIPLGALPNTTEEGFFHLWPTTALERRMVMMSKESITQILVQWGKRGSGKEGGNIVNLESAKGVIESNEKIGDDDDLNREGHLWRNEGFGGRMRCKTPFRLALVEVGN